MELWIRVDDHVAAVVMEQWERQNSRGPSFFVFCVVAHARIWCKLLISVDLPLSKYNRYNCEGSISSRKCIQHLNVAVMSGSYVGTIDVMRIIVC
jgi:hypothetical protein